MEGKDMAATMPDEMSYSAMPQAPPMPPPGGGLGAAPGGGGEPVAKIEIRPTEDGGFVATCERESGKTTAYAFGSFEELTGWLPGELGAAPAGPAAPAPMPEPAMDETEGEGEAPPMDEEEALA